MKVLQIHTLYRQPGGEDVVAAHEAAALAEAGHEVVTHTAHNPTTPVASAVALAQAPWNTSSARRVRRLAQRVAPDVVHVHNTWFELTPSIVHTLGALDLPVVMTLHNYRFVCVNAMLFRDGGPCQTCVGRSPLPGVRYRCYRGSAVSSTAVAATIAIHRGLGTWHRHVRRFLVLNEFARDIFERSGFPAERMIVKPNATTDPGPRGSDPSASRTVLYVGRVETVKGITTLVDAWEAARPDGLELLVIGDGDLRGDLSRRRVPGIHFAGSLPADEVRRRMLRARALLFPTHLYEGQPMVTVEAFSAGLPVLASALGGNREVVGELGDRWLVDAADPRAWAVALTGLADDEAVDEAGATGRLLFEQRYGGKANVSRLEEAYREAIGDGPH
jgi:glycosyltransferase involved in cell wall biosynthesis